MINPTKAGLAVCDEKHPAGGNGGGQFDSGHNLSGVTSVSIECGSFNWEQKYDFTIKRIFLEFEEANCKDMFWGHGVDNKGENKIFKLDLPPDDVIEKVVVWADHRLANAVQFHLASGHVSQMYGIPAPGAKETVFGGEEGTQLSGVYGRFGGVIDSLGFSFAKTENAVPSLVGHEEWTEAGSAFETSLSEKAVK